MVILLGVEEFCIEVSNVSLGEFLSAYATGLRGSTHSVKCFGANFDRIGIATEPGAAILNTAVQRHAFFEHLA